VGFAKAFYSYKRRNYATTTVNTVCTCKEEHTSLGIKSVPFSLKYLKDNDERLDVHLEKVPRTVTHPA